MARAVGSVCIKHGSGKSIFVGIESCSALIC